MDIVKSFVKSQYNKRPVLTTVLGLLFARYIYAKLTRNRRKDVVGKVVLITGAGSGLGRLMALRFAALGAKLALVDVNGKGLEETVQMLRIPSNHVHTYVADITNSEKIREMRTQINAHLGRVDILINNAGIVAGKYIEQLTELEMRRTMDVNALAPMLLTSVFFPDMLQRGSGHVVNIASAAGYIGVNKLTDYCASKAAAQRFIDALREEIRNRGDISEETRRGLKLTTVNPYFINTGMFAGVKTIPFLLPILTPEWVVDQIIDGVLRETETVNLPWLVSTNGLLMSLFPHPMLRRVLDFLGVSSSMENFKGRENNLALPAEVLQKHKQESQN